MANKKRVVSGMRTTGDLHLGHYHGVIKNLIKLQDEFECFFFAADLHALTTHNEHTDKIRNDTIKLFRSWLACGVSPEKASLFVQSQVPAHAELGTILNMFTPVGWLERVPSYKDQKDKYPNSGFLFYPVLMSADVLLYDAEYVPVGEDQVSHLEIAREIARRFNFLTSKSNGFFELMEQTIKKAGKSAAKTFKQLKNAYQEKGEEGALEKAKSFLESLNNINEIEKQDLYSYLQGHGKLILHEPQPLLTEFAKIPGLDGRKMSKSYNNTLYIGEEFDSLNKKIKQMKTDPARVKLSDPGEPTKCPVWDLHKVYSDNETKAWVENGCRKAEFGCLECKKPLIDSIEKEQAPIREELHKLDDKFVIEVIRDGQLRANASANETLAKVKESIGLLT